MATNSHWPAGPIGLSLARNFDPLQVLEDIGSASWAAVKRAVLSLLGGPAFAIGTAYGMGESLVTSVVELLDLIKTLVLADVADVAFRTESNWALINPLNWPRQAGAAIGSRFFKKQLQDAQATRDTLIRTIEYAVTHPMEVLGALGASYVAKWNNFKALMGRSDINSRFSAGRIFGEVLLEVLGIFAGGAAAAKLATKIPGLARMAARLERIGKAIKVRVTPAARTTPRTTPAPRPVPRQAPPPPPPPPVRSRFAHLKGKERAAAERVYNQSLNSKEELVVGRLADTAAGEQLGMRRLNEPDWTLNVNDAWIQGGIDARKPFYLGSDISIRNLRSSNPTYPTTVFFRELQQLRSAGYVRRGNLMVPPPN